jgi:hypothetical protein
MKNVYNRKNKIFSKNNELDLKFLEQKNNNKMYKYYGR